jgi:hypothetical protein
MLAMIDECTVAAEKANDVLARLQAVSMYRTETYLETPEGTQASNQDRILDCGLRGARHRPDVTGILA